MVARKARALAARVRRRVARRVRRRSPLSDLALGQGWRLDRAERALLKALEERLTGILEPRVAVLADRRPNRLDRLVRTRYPRAHVTLVNVGRGPARVHTALAAAGRFDVVVDDQSAAPLADAFDRAFLHLRPGGGYLAAGPAARLDPLRSRLSALRRAADSRPAKGTPQRRVDDRALGGAIGSVEDRGDAVVVVNAVAALAKLYDPEIDQVLARRPGSPDRTLQTLPGASFTSRCRVTQSDGLRNRAFFESYDAPAVSLREYHHPICVPGQVVAKGNLLLPDSYRHNRRKRLTNKYTDDLGRRFAAIPGLDEGDAEPQELEGTYFYLDNEVRGHFGHALTEQLSRLWAMPLARRVAPDLKAVLAINKGRELQPFEYELYGTVGFEPDDLVFLREPARVERLLAATPMFSMPQYVHPEIARTWSDVGDALAAKAPQRQYPRRMFVSRRLTKRACLNTPEVEELFARHGFEIVYPEDYPLGEQIAMFRHAEVIGGFAGSGLFHLCFVEQPKLVIMLAHAAYTASNEYMMSAVRGHEIVAVISEPDLDRAQHLKNSFQAPFRLDLEREGRFLTKTLTTL